MTENPSSEPRDSATALTDILASLRDRVMGVSESVLSTADGLLVVADVESVHAESVAALAAATLGVGRRMADHTGAGPLREVVVRGGSGHVVVTSVGDRALLTVMGDAGLDLAAFQRESPAAVEELSKVLAEDVPG
ncbi:roadblock/LC7 domain-containing protein [Streptomyces griseorubiginosus]|uniref:roadblock/LC7 domain-containing protein n=1 Tax=Streptomyces griseorubiginosus TaxID=67304 RepID=UPI001AD76506|nr:roadblock/LC7 domain-containing protein [Streptomyces griseorubiginosus]MBO4259383.1 dynein regulation protein LC7 [Streptomyces griseorubiginosus]